MNIRQSVVEDALDKYFESRDFNGLPISEISEKYGVSVEDLKPDLRALIQDDKIEVWFGNVHPNTHIKAFSWVSKEQQIEFLDSIGLTKHCCIYPSRATLSDEPRLAKYLDRPYTHEIAKGAGQLDYRTFELSVLEFYRNDPRYYYQTNDINGSICIEDAFFESENFPKKDQVLRFPHESFRSINNLRAD